MTEDGDRVVLSRDCRLQEETAFASMASMPAVETPCAGEKEDLLVMLEQGYKVLRALGQPRLAAAFRMQGAAADSREAVIELLLRSIGQRRQDIEAGRNACRSPHPKQPKRT